MFTNMIKKIPNKEIWMETLSVAKHGTLVIDIPYVSCDPPKSCFHDYIRYDIMVDCRVLPELPMDGNPRGVDPTSPSFKGVFKCLCQSDTLLQDSHNGGDIFANHVENDEVNKVLRITFSSESGMGLINGGTSMGAILCARYLDLLKDGHLITFRVRDYNIEELTGAQREACVAQAHNLNNMVAQKDEAIGFQLGHYDAMIKALSMGYRNLFVFKPNSGEEVLEKCYNSNYLIRLLEGMHIKVYSDSTVAPTVINNGVGGLVKGYFAKKMEKQEVYEYLLPLLNDFVGLYGHILYNWDADLRKSTNSKDAEVVSNLLRYVTKTDKKTGEVVTKLVTTGFKTPFYYLNPDKYKRDKEWGRIGAESFVWAVYTAFRANIDYDEENKVIGWKVDPYILWNKCNIALWREVNSSYVNDCNRVTTEYIGCSGSWRRLYEIVENAIADIQAEFQARCA